MSQQTAINQMQLLLLIICPLQNIPTVGLWVVSCYILLLVYSRLVFAFL